MTNGLLLERHLDTLVEFRDIVGNIRLSVDGATKATYEQIRVSVGWEEWKGILKSHIGILLRKGTSFILISHTAW